MAKLKFEDSGEEIEIEDEGKIADTCEEKGVPFACTEGICGTCVIEVSEGEENLSPKTQEEIDFLGEDACGERLACQCRIQKDSVTIRF